MRGGLWGGGTGGVGRLSLLAAWQSSICRPGINTISIYKSVEFLSLRSPFGITRWSLMVPNSKLKGRIIHPIHQRMLDSFLSIILSTVLE